jgi:hypothetical protein
MTRCWSGSNDLRAKVGPIMKPGVALLGASFIVFAASASALAQQPPAGSGLQAGGLRPPEAVQAESTPNPQAQTEAQLDRAVQEDSGRGLEFVALNAEVGPEFLGLHTFKADHLVDSKYIESKGTGLAVGAGLGVRLLAFTVGARFRYANFSDFALWTLGAEGGFHIPLGRLEPYFTLGAGYASLGSFDKANSGFNPKSAHGFNVRGGVGVDYYLTNTFSIGGNLAGDVLFLSRKASLALPINPDPDAMRANAVYAADGSGIGAAATLSAVFGLHF